LNPIKDCHELQCGKFFISYDFSLHKKFAFFAASYFYQCNNNFHFRASLPSLANDRFFAVSELCRRLNITVDIVPLAGVGVKHLHTVVVASVVVGLAEQPVSESDLQPLSTNILGSKTKTNCQVF
jgi:hypothetical protein